jgi:hypothetical protein
MLIQFSHFLYSKLCMLPKSTQISHHNKILITSSLLYLQTDFVVAYQCIFLQSKLCKNFAMLLGDPPPTQTVVQLAKIFPVFYGTQGFIAVRFQVLTAANMKMTVFWDLAQCNFVEIVRRFWGAYYLHALIALMMETVSTSETSVSYHLRLMPSSQESRKAYDCEQFFLYK